jgi:hypothetical protein
MAARAFPGACEENLSRPHPLPLHDSFLHERKPKQGEPLGWLGMQAGKGVGVIGGVCVFPQPASAEARPDPVYLLSSPVVK